MVIHFENYKMMSMNLPAYDGHLRSSIELLIHSNLVAAVCVATLTLLAFILLKHPIIVTLILVAFSGTLLIYTLNRFSDIREDSINLPGRVAFIRRYGRIILIFSAVVYGVSLVMIALHSTIAAVVAVLPVLIAISYSFFRLKRYFLIKNILTCAGVICSILIVGAYYDDFSTGMLFLTVIVFIAALVNTIIFDIKDIKGDTLCNIRTIPVTCGFTMTKYCCYALLIPLFLITFYLTSRDPRFAVLFPFLGYIAKYTYLLKDPDNYPGWYFGLFVDGEYIFLFFIILILVLGGFLPLS